MSKHHINADTRFLAAAVPLSQRNIKWRSYPETVRIPMQCMHVDPAYHAQNDKMQFNRQHALLLKNIQGMNSLRKENLRVLQFAIGEILPKHCVTDFECLRCGRRIQS